MAASVNRATRITQLQSALKKNYKPILQPERPLMEVLLYASLLEDAPYEAADEAMARLERDYFDWNEIRVTTVTELSDVLKGLPDPTAAALRLKKNLQSLFEAYYAFDLEELKKLTVGRAVESLEKLSGMTHFVLAYVVQHALDGHMIPLDHSSLQILTLCEIVTPAEAQKGKAPGLDRAIPKAKGIEFGSMLHQAAATLVTHPKDKQLWTWLKVLNPNANPSMVELNRSSVREPATTSPVNPPPSASASTSASAPPRGREAAPAHVAHGPAKSAPTDSKTRKEAEKKSDTDPKKPVAKVGDTKAQESKGSYPKKPEVRNVEPKKPESKKPEPKKLEPKQPEPKKPESKKPEIKKPDLKKPEIKKPEIKKTEIKKPETKPPTKPAARRKPK
jgi:endonuclease-3